MGNALDSTGLNSKDCDWLGQIPVRKFPLFPEMDDVIPTCASWQSGRLATVLPPFPHSISLSVQAMSTFQSGTRPTKGYVDPTPMPEDVPKVAELGVTSAPLKSAAFFIGAYCKEFNGV